MYYCPYCGNQVEQTENFCVTCGESLPENLENRAYVEKRSWKKLILPMTLILIGIISVLSAHFFLSYQEQKALAKFKQAEEMALIGDYEQAKQLTDQALNKKKNFPVAQQVSQFLEKAITYQEEIANINALNEQKQYNESLSIIHQIESKLESYTGQLVEQLQQELQVKEDETLIQQLTTKLDDEPTTDTLKAILYQLESINNKQTENLKQKTEEKLISMTTKKATNLLEENQFSQALTVVEDSLTILGESEQLKNLETTINKEKVAFETAREQRIEQALTKFEEEKEVNQNDAVELLNLDIKQDKNDLKVTGELKSVASVPIHSILVQYTIKDGGDNELLQHEVYVYPETLYPNEVGQIEFTHSNVAEEDKTYEIATDEITWFLND
ncbi:hypothetical protein J416_07152 [Gracilibacillus halophilus YIM-C55.5]|uniref:Zinc-ribbon domain-containing protein n=1 Tax=Gracilibacillus halophilus YIM-C55.5 TaxID=1308866 RepID=N4WA74_9BACI|nr:zinc ribbon domain-containing protein [Gracilibacillus halophilus]ENH97198.1 hypothetical protein J416_07152 [Gracilibacillus halophilus YIM-C55.5]